LDEWIMVKADLLPKPHICGVSLRPLAGKMVNKFSRTVICGVMPACPSHHFGTGWPMPNRNGVNQNFSAITDSGNSEDRSCGAAVSGDTLRVLALASQKGGSGKTTLSGHSAAQAQRAGAGPVVLIDIDPQGSLADWWNEREADFPAFAQTTVGAWLRISRSCASRASSWR
jgi:hypothetical protein